MPDSGLVGSVAKLWTFPVKSMKGALVSEAEVTKAGPTGDELPNDTGILRALVRHNRIDVGGDGKYPCAGVCALVESPGRVRAGDAVRLVWRGRASVISQNLFGDWRGLP